MLNNDTPTSVKLGTDTVKKLKLLKALYHLKNVDAVVEHLLAENGFGGKQMSISVQVEPAQLVASAAELRSVMAVDDCRLTQRK